MSTPHENFANVTFVHGDENAGGTFAGSKGWGNYDPSDSPDDPHDEGYEVGIDGTPGAGPVPDNIVNDGGGEFDCNRSRSTRLVPGPFSRSRQGR